MISQAEGTKLPYYVASFSGGKDSTAMVLRLIERGDPLDEVIFCDTTMEFPAMLRHVEKVKAAVEAAGVKFTTLRAAHDFEYYLLEHEPERKPGSAGHGMRGYSWPGPLFRWCTARLKTDVIRRYLTDLKNTHDVQQYVGLAADEPDRLEKKNNQKAGLVYPLVDWGWTESDALEFCKRQGYDWEGLYDLFPRVSCWLCPLQSLQELRTLRQHFPDLWQRLRRFDSEAWTSYRRDYTVAELEERFQLEEERTAQGLTINPSTKDFREALRKRLEPLRNTRGGKK